ncbi:hypothetical protein KPL71_012521 [Citrus sinensis]|uniref:Uncharacterized protein n=1 Tax=Citrus sinensis TaxID=2711 RepID=A0ACB8LC01_CITSI|nr:hypothetical protein KPL71_012521 [Citrus sinensis]
MNSRNDGPSIWSLILEQFNDTLVLRVEQGSLTGENTDIQGKKCMLFAGITIVNENYVCSVIQIGMETEIRKVHKQIYVASQSEEDTPLKKKLNDFGEVLTKMIGVICVLYG